MIKTIPIRLDYYQYCTETWENIFAQFDFRKIKSIIDFCPGWSPKLELALLNTNFSGTLYAIDKSADNLDIFRSLIDPFPKKFTLKCLNADIVNLGDGFANLSADLILANHIVDDMLMAEFLKGSHSEIELFENQTLMQQAWLKILKQESCFLEIENKLREIIAKRLNPGGYLLLAQYLGYQENLYGLKNVYKKCKYIVDNLERDLCRTGEFTRESKLIEEAFHKIKNPYFPKNDLLCLRKNN